MSYFEEGFASYLKGYAGLAALVGASIYPDLMPEGNDDDCVTWQVLPGQELRVGSYVEPTIMVKSWSRDAAPGESAKSSRLATIAIDLQVRAALEAFHGLMGAYHVWVATDPRGDDYEPETGWRSRMRLATPRYREP